MEIPGSRSRPRIAFFDYPDVFEDFYPHYGVSREEFAARWAGTGSHAFLSLLQREVGDVVWYVLCLDPRAGRGGRHRLGFAVRFVPSSRLHRLLWRAFWLPNAAWRWRRFYRAWATVASYAAPLCAPLVRALWRDRPDCLFVQSYSSGKFDVLVLLARLLRVPLVAHHAGGEAESHLGRALKRWTVPAADRLIASGRREARELEERFRVPPERIDVILTPIDTDAYRPLEREAACRELGLDPQRRYVLFVGRLDDSVKRVRAIFDAFVRASAAHPDADLLVAGSGPDEAALRSEAARRDPERLRLLGWVSGPEEKARLYAVAECLVLASHREGFPSVVGEAMACGLPVVSTSVGAVEELVVPGVTGWLVPPGDDPALAEALCRILERPDRAAAMGRRAREAALRRVSPSVVTAQLRRCFVEAGARLPPGHGPETPDERQDARTLAD